VNCVGAVPNTTIIPTRIFLGLQGKINCQNKFVVIRDGQQVDVTETELVVGDIVLIKQGCFCIRRHYSRQNPLSIIGDKIPADGVILGNNELNIDESLHNGVSDKLKKSVESCPMVFAGTNG